MLMCLWVIRETSRCGPDILSDERKCDPSAFTAFSALKSTKHQFGSAVLECVKLKWTLISKPQNVTSHKVITKSVAWSERVRGFRAVWPISPGGRMSGRLGRPSWETSVVLLTDFTWPDWAVIPLHMLQSPQQCLKGDHLLPLKLLTPPQCTITNTHTHTHTHTRDHVSLLPPTQSQSLHNVIMWNHIPWH